MACLLFHLLIAENVGSEKKRMSKTMVIWRFVSESLELMETRRHTGIVRGKIISTYFGRQVIQMYKQITDKFPVNVMEVFCSYIFTIKFLNSVNRYASIKFEIVFNLNLVHFGCKKYIFIRKIDFFISRKFDIRDFPYISKCQIAFKFSKSKIQ